MIKIMSDEIFSFFLTIDIKGNENGQNKENDNKLSWLQVSTIKVQIQYPEIYTLVRS